MNDGNQSNTKPGLVAVSKATNFRSGVSCCRYESDTFRMVPGRYILSSGQRCSIGWHRVPSRARHTAGHGAAWTLWMLLWMQGFRLPAFCGFRYELDSEFWFLAICPTRRGSLRTDPQTPVRFGVKQRSGLALAIEREGGSILWDSESKGTTPNFHETPTRTAAFSRQAASPSTVKSQALKTIGGLALADCAKMNLLLVNCTPFFRDLKHLREAWEVMALRPQKRTKVNCSCLPPRDKLPDPPHLPSCRNNKDSTLNDPHLICR